MIFKNYKGIFIILILLILIPFISGSFQTSGGGYNLIVGGKSSSVIQTNNESSILIITPQEESAFQGSDGEGNTLLIGDYFSKKRINVNSLPTIPTLLIPTNATSTITRQPNFTWTSTDNDGDTIYYTVLIDDNSEFTSPERSDNQTKDSYVPTAPLKVDTDYYWKVRATDQITETTSFSPMYIVTIDSVIIISINGTKSINFGTKLPGYTDDTTDDNPLPLLVQNDGNCFLNLTVNASRPLWASQGLNTQYLRYKAGVNESGSYGNSQTSWTNMLSTDALFVDLLNYANATDTARLECSIEVPSDETPGDKNTDITFTAILGDHS